MPNKENSSERYVPCTNIEFVGCEEVIGQLALPFIAVLSPEHNVHRRSVYAGDLISVERILLIFFGRCLVGVGIQVFSNLSTDAEISRICTFTFVLKFLTSSAKPLPD